jgi:hypothetical protein
MVAPVAVVVRVNLVPAPMPAVPLEAAPVGAIVSVGKAVILRFEFVGQELMRGAASEKTERTPSGVSNADGMAAALEAMRMNV